MKICEKAQGPGRRRFVTTSGSYHGKTHGAMAVTTSGGFQRGFLMGIPAENVLTGPYGDLAALEALLAARGSECIALLVEAIQGQGMNAAPAGYLKGAAELCRKHGVLTIFDEVKAGIDVGPVLPAPVRVYLAYRRQGAGDYREPYPAIDQRDSWPTIFEGVVVKTFRIAASSAVRLGEATEVSADAGINHSANDRRVPGASKTRFEGRIRVALEPSWARIRTSLF